MFVGGWTADPDHRFMRPRPQVVAATPDPPALPLGVTFPDGVGGARSAGNGLVLVEEPVVVAAKARVGAILGAATPGIPAVDAAGNLPAGVHAASRGEFLARFGGNERRAVLLDQLQLGLHELQAAGVDHVVVGGSVAGAKAWPNDVDMAWVSNGRASVDDVASAMSRLSTTAPAVSIHRADQLLENAPTIPTARPGWSFLEFFMHDRAGAPRGVVLLPTADDVLAGARALSRI